MLSPGRAAIRHTLLDIRHTLSPNRDEAEKPATPTQWPRSPHISGAVTRSPDQNEYPIKTLTGGCEQNAPAALIKTLASGSGPDQNPRRQP